MINAPLCSSNHFSRDVAAAIDDGLAWFDRLGLFTTPERVFGDNNYALGLAALALMERRVSADQNASPQGYENASPADQVKIQTVMSYIITRTTGINFSSYRDGGDLMAVSLYLRTGGPNVQTGLAAARKLPPSSYQIFEIIVIFSRQQIITKSVILQLL